LVVVPQFIDLDSCKTCHTHWSAHYSYMTKSECQFKLHDQAPFAESWKRGMESKDGSAGVTWRQGTVDSSETLRLVYRRSYIPLSLSEFKDKYGHAPSKLKIKPVSLTDPEDANRSMYLVVNPDRPRLELDVERLEEVTKLEQAFHGKVIYEGELNNFFNHEKTTMKKESWVHSKAFSDEDIRTRIARLRPGDRGGTSSPLASQPQVAIEESDDSEPGSEDEQDHESGGGEQQAEAANAKTPDKASGRVNPRVATPSAPAQSPRSSRSGSAAASKAAPATLKKTTLGSTYFGSDDEHDTGYPASNAREHIAKMNIPLILADKKRGQHIRNAKDWASKNPGAADIDLLREKIALASKCTLLHRGGADAMSAETFQQTCKDIKDAGDVDCPSLAKSYIFDKHLKLWMDHPQRMQKLDDLLEMAIPWPLGDQFLPEDQDDAEADNLLSCEFDPTRPALRSLDASDAEKALKFGEIMVKGVLAPLLKHEENGKADVIKFSARALHELMHMPDSVPDEYAGVLAELLTCFRVVLLVTFTEVQDGGTYGDYNDIRNPPKCNKLVQSLAASLRATPYWKNVLTDYVKFRQIYERDAPRLSEIDAALEGDVQQVPLATVVGLLDDMEVMMHDMPPGICDKTVTSLLGCVDAHYHVVRAKLALNKGGTPVDDLKLYEKFLKAAKKVFPKKSEFQESINSVQKLLAGAEQVALVNAFGAACSQLSADITDASMAAAVVQAADRARGLEREAGHGSTGQAPIQALGEKLHRELCCGASEAIMKNVELSKAMTKVCETLGPWLPKGLDFAKGMGMPSLLAAVVATIQLSESMSECKALGTETAEQARAMNNQRAKELMAAKVAAYATIDTLLKAFEQRGVGMDTQGLSKVVDHATSFLDAVAAEKVDNIKAALTDTSEVSLGNFAGGIEGGGSWKDPG
jgi:hypothetical protein